MAPYYRVIVDFLPKNNKYVSKIQILLAKKIRKKLDYKEWFDRVILKSPLIIKYYFYFLGRK